MPQSLSDYIPPGRLRNQQKRVPVEGQPKKANAKKSIVTDWRFITGLREVMGLDPREDIWHEPIINRKTS